MKIDKTNIFNKLQMGEYIWGNAFHFVVSDFDLSIHRNQIQILDEICKTENWNEISNKWNSMTYPKCSELLKDSIEFDMAYSQTRITPKNVAVKLHAGLLKGFTRENSYCYSNWLNNHWRSNQNGSFWTSLTENTFDLSTVFINQETILMTCFRSED